MPMTGDRPVDQGADRAGRGAPLRRARRRGRLAPPDRRRRRQRQQLGGAVPLRHQGPARPRGVRVPPAPPARAPRPAPRRTPSRRPAGVGRVRGALDVRAERARRQQLHELRRDAHAVRPHRRVRRAARRPGHVHARRTTRTSRRCSAPRRAVAHPSHQAGDGLVGARGRRPRAGPRPSGQPVLPFAVALGDVVDGIVGFLEAPASAETLAALERADPDELDRFATRRASTIPRVDRSARPRRPRARTPRAATPTTCGRSCGPRRPSSGSSPRATSRSGPITKHADILDVASQPMRFSNEHGLMLGPKGAPGQPIEMVVTLDPPRHGPLRRVAMRRLTPRAIQAAQRRHRAARARGARRHHRRRQRRRGVRLRRSTSPRRCRSR